MCTHTYIQALRVLMYDMCTYIQALNDLRYKYTPKKPKAKPLIYTSATNCRLDQLAIHTNCRNTSHEHIQHVLSRVHYATVNTPHWTALVIFYVISLHTVANHSDDIHYHTAVNIINVL